MVKQPNILYFLHKTMSESPKYDLTEFINACSDERNVVVPVSVLNDAQRLFNLRSKKQLLDAIYAKDVHITDFVNCRELEKNNFRDKSGNAIPVLVDAYYFCYTGDDGYLAFHIIPIPPNKWRLKSFHEQEKDAVTLLGDCLTPNQIERLKRIGNKGN